MADDEERILEEQLEQQLEEHRDSLSALDDAIASDPTNTELVAIYEELVKGIKDAEEGLLHLKRARLLQEADLVLHNSRNITEVVETKPLDPKDVEPEPLEDPCYSIGSKCRFRNTNGRWYNGVVVGLEESNNVKVSFLIPTSENMLMCKFFLQQRCRFRNNCRLSHGIDVPLSSLRKYVTTKWDQSYVGSSIWAVSDSKAGLWRKAELESWNDELGLGQVVFQDDGSSVKLGVEAISLSQYAQMSDDEESEVSSSEQSDSSEYEEDSVQGLGFLESTNQQKDVQTGTAIFAKWENHTRGIASKMMANMGYREGMGLGVSGQGLLDPISVRPLKPKQSLDHALESRGMEGKEGNRGKKRTRGGKRKRCRKFAEALRAAKEEEDDSPDVFSLINSRLAMHGEAENGGGSAKKIQNKDTREGKKEDRRSLIAHEEEVKELRRRIEKLEEMVNRNKKEKVVYEAAIRKLNETRKSLADAEAAHASASNAVVSKEKEKRWLKF